MNTAEKAFYGLFGTVAAIYMVMALSPNHILVADSLTETLFINFNSSYPFFMIMFVAVALINGYLDDVQNENKSHTELK